jgi:ABC-type transporter Mla maintaining outer membrane lipid asymmetry ATPase subunit MlaF
VVPRAPASPLFLDFPQPPEDEGENEENVQAECQLMIRVQGLTKHFGALKAVDGLDLDISQGEFFAFLGPNAAGKTTTIKMIA